MLILTETNSPLCGFIPWTAKRRTSFDMSELGALIEDLWLTQKPVTRFERELALKPRFCEVWRSEMALKKHNQQVLMRELRKRSKKHPYYVHTSYNLDKNL